MENKIAQTSNRNSCMFTNCCGKKMPQAEILKIKKSHKPVYKEIRSGALLQLNATITECHQIEHAKV